MPKQRTNPVGAAIKEGKIRIDNVVFDTVIRVGKAEFANIFYDINLEVDQILPHTKSASEIKGSTSNNPTIAQKGSGVNTNNTQNSEKYSENGKNNTENGKNVRNKLDVAEGDGVSYNKDTNYTFAKQVYDALRGKMKREFSVFVGRTPKLLLKSGLEQEPILINQGHLRDINQE